MKYGIIGGLVIWAVILFGISQCEAAGYFYAKIGVGKNVSPGYSETRWIDQNSAGCRIAAGHRHQLWGSFYGDFNVSHHSQCAVGYPRDSRPETASEHWYYDIEYRF